MNKNTPLMLMYKGYRLHKAPIKGGPHKVGYVMKVGNYHLPRKFEWTDKNNTFAFKKYVDALVNRDVLESQKYEDEGYAINHEFEAYEGKPPVITISPMRLAQIIFCEDPLELPADTIVRIRSCKSDEKSTRFVAQEFLAELAAEGVTPDMLHALVERIAAGHPVEAKPFSRNRDLPATEKDEVSGRRNGRAFPREHICNNSGANLTWAERMDGQQYEPPARRAAPVAPTPEQSPFLPPLPEPEHVIDVQYKTAQAYRVLSVAKNGEERYFIRRLMHAKGFVILTQTAWTLDGPWHTVHLDDVELAAEGLTVEDAA